MNVEGNKRNKFLKLNYNLKLTIFSYLRIHIKLAEVSILSKRAMSAIKKSEIYKFLRAQMNFIIKDIQYESKSLENFKQNFQILSEDNFKTTEINDQNINDIFRYLLLIKFEKFSHFYLKEDLIMNDFSDFLLLSKNIKKLILKDQRFNYNNNDFKTLFIHLPKILKNKNINALQFNDQYFENYGEHRGKNVIALLSQFSSITRFIVSKNLFSSNNGKIELLMEALSTNINITDFHLFARL